MARFIVKAQGDGKEITRLGRSGGARATVQGWDGGILVIASLLNDGTEEYEVSTVEGNNADGYGGGIRPQWRLLVSPDGSHRIDEPRP